VHDAGAKVEREMENPVEKLVEYALLFHPPGRPSYLWPIVVYVASSAKLTTFSSANHTGPYLNDTSNAKISFARFQTTGRRLMPL
jgi:hypothetical protein